jgi:hypothetical protein
MYNYIRICLEGLRKSTKKLSQDGRYDVPRTSRLLGKSIDHAGVTFNDKVQFLEWRKMKYDVQYDKMQLWVWREVW